MLPYRSNDEAMIEDLRKDPELATELLRVAIEENTKDELKKIVFLINEAGYEVSVTSKPQPTPRKRAKPAATKKAARHPASRRRAGRAASAVALA